MNLFIAPPIHAGFYLGFFFSLAETERRSSLAETRQHEEKGIWMNKKRVCNVTDLSTKSRGSDAP